MAVAMMPSPNLHFGKRPCQEDLAQCIARGAVDNMEFVLSDLQGVMGDIQSLVAHIDSVMCRSGRRARRERRQDARNQQEQKENEESEQGAECNPGQAAEQKSPDPGGSSIPLRSKSQHCMKKPLGQNFSRNSPSHPSIKETISEKSPQEGPISRKHAQKKMAKRFSDSVLQEATNLPRTDSFAYASNKNKITKKRSSELFSPQSTIVDLEPRESPAVRDKTQKRQRTKASISRQVDLNVAQNPDTLWKQSKDSNLETLVLPDSPPTRRAIYSHLGRDDSLASRGEYDLETQEARLGNRCDFSDGDQSHLSLEDSPLRLRYLNKTKKDEITPRGSVAIVYPFVKTQSAELHPEDKVSESPDDIDYYGRHRVCKSAFATPQVYKVSLAEQVQAIAGDYEVPVLSCYKGRGFTREPRQRYVYNKAFVPVTPTEQSSLSPSQKCLGQSNISDFQKRVQTENFLIPNRERSVTGEGWNHNSLPNSPKVRRSTAVKVGFDFDTFDSNQNRLHSRPVYARIEGSPASTRSSCSTVRKPVAHHYYYSIDSDLDSDIIPEYLDPRGLTPDLDWSYLNLIGSDLVQNIVPLESKATFLNDYEMPITLLPNQQSCEINERNPEDMTIVPFYHVLASKHSSSSPSDSSAGPTENVNDSREESTSPLLTCTGAIDTDDYCGCYESYLDSVLENVSGFETFEAAVESLNDDDILNEAYVNFDDQFEEDEWDVGFDSESACDFSLDYPLTYLDPNNDARYSDFFSEKSFDISSMSSSKSLKRPCALSLSKRIASNISNTEVNKKEKMLKEHHDHSSDGDFEYRLMESEKKCVEQSVTGALESPRHQSQGHQVARKTSWTKCSVDSLTEELKSGSQKSPLLWEDECPQLMSISYDTSCRAVASDSPMSLCSSEEAEFSPVSDRLITSSEGDDLITSHDESYFLPSPDSSGTDAVDNARESRALGRTKASELTQQFLMSLRDIYERHSGAGGATSLSVHYDEPVGYINKSRDSSFSGLSSENGSTITASTSTATDATLTDDNTTDDNTQQNASLNLGTTNTMGSETQSGSYNEDIIISGGYNRNVNTWTAYAVVHVAADDVSDGTASDAMYNDNMLGSMYSMAASHRSNENTDVV